MGSRMLMYMDGLVCMCVGGCCDTRVQIALNQAEPMRDIQFVSARNLDQAITHHDNPHLLLSGLAGLSGLSISSACYIYIYTYISLYIC